MLVNREKNLLAVFQSPCGLLAVFASLRSPCGICLLAVFSPAGDELGLVTNLCR